MPRSTIQAARTLVGALALLCLAACVPTATVSVPPTVSVSPSPTATTPPTATPAPVLAPTPADVPAGWQVLATEHFSLAYPPDWTIQPPSDNPAYFIVSPTRQSELIVDVQPQGDVSRYCLPAASGAKHTTFASLSMTYLITGEGDSLRTWYFANAQHTLYGLDAEDTQADAATQAQDEAILSTFRPDNADPWQC